MSAPNKTISKLSVTKNKADELENLVTSSIIRKDSLEKVMPVVICEKVSGA